MDRLLFFGKDFDIGFHAGEFGFFLRCIVGIIILINVVVVSSVSPASQACAKDDNCYRDKGHDAEPNNRDGRSGKAAAVSIVHKERSASKP